MSQARDIPAALRAFRRHSGVLRTKQALDLGIHPATLYELRDSGKVRRLPAGYTNSRTPLSPGIQISPLWALAPQERLSASFRR